MRALMAAAAAPLATGFLCAICWWLWVGNHGLSHLLRLDDLDLQVRVAAIFAFLSLADKVFAWLGKLGLR